LSRPARGVRIGNVQPASVTKRGPMSANSQASETVKTGISAAQAIARLWERYAPFEEEPRLPPEQELVFTILSQHTSDINSARAFGSLMARFGTLEEVARADVANIEEAISCGGLARIKAPRIKEVLNWVLDLNGSLDLSFLRELPLNEARAWLRQLPGIGPKSAGIILSFALGMPAMAIDTHIYRVCKRLGLIGPKVTTEKAHEILEAAVAPEQVFKFHASFITHGRRVCKAQRPRCEECVLAYGCPAREEFMALAAENPPNLPLRKGGFDTDSAEDYTRTSIPHSPPLDKT